MVKYTLLPVVNIFVTYCVSTAIVCKLIVHSYFVKHSIIVILVLPTQTFIHHFKNINRQSINT